MSVEATRLPSGSQLSVFRRQKDFLDCYKSNNVPESLGLYDATIAAMTEGPVWARYLLKLRNKVVGPFGLKTGDVLAPEIDRAGHMKPGDKMGVFRVYSQTENEIIMGEDDKHLDFRVSVYREGANLYMATWVHPHNVWGWGYLALILPFHKIIVRNSLARLEST